MHFASPYGEKCRLTTVWETVAQDLPPLIEGLKKVIADR